MLSPSDAVKLYRHFAERHPQNARAWFLLGQALRVAKAPRDEQRAALLKAIRLDAFSSPSNELAWLSSQQGKGQEALSYATRAAQLEPWQPEGVGTLAASLGAAGECDAAVKAEQRAMDLLCDDHPVIADDDRKRLKAHRTQCLNPQR